LLKRALLVLALSTSVIAAGMGAAGSAAATASPTNPTPVTSAFSHRASTLADRSAPATSSTVAHHVFADAALDSVVAKLKSGKSIAGVANAHLQAGRLRVEVLHGAGTSLTKVLAIAHAINVRQTTSTVITADVPTANLARLQSSGGVTFVRLPQAVDATSATQAVQQGTYGADVVTKTNAAAWHKAGWSGEGQAIGIIDAGWNKTIYAKDVKKHELSKVSGTICKSNGKTCSVWASYGVHGDAVAEIIHDEAPAAKYYFAAANTLQDYKTVIDYFAAKHVKVITRSLGTFLDGPGDGTGPSDAIQDYAISKGITWFNSAGNEGINFVPPGQYAGYYYGGYWRGSWNPDPDNSKGWGGYELFGPASHQLPFLDMACGYFEGFRWSDWGTNRTDYAVEAYSLKGNLIASSDNNQTAGAPPIEGAKFNSINCTKYPEYLIAVRLVNAGNGTSGDVLEAMTNSAFFDDSSTGGLLSNAYSASDAFVDSFNPGAAAVGAVDPVKGTAIGSYSANGPTNDGRIKPDISAASGSVTAAYGKKDPFHGTSAASPRAASAALLVLEEHPSYTPAQLIAEIEANNIVDRGATGVDNVFGHGEVVLGTPLSNGPGITLKPTPIPTIAGTIKVGKVAVAKPGTWGPSKVTLTYQWLRNGVKISKATKSKYTLVTADGGTDLSVIVTGKKKGYTTVSETSVAKAVPLVAFATAKVPTISGAATQGGTLKAVAGTWKPKATFTYQWFATASGTTTAISGATSSTYILTASEVGKTITVVVTGSKANYKPTPKTSKATKVVTGPPVKN
jgi:hypothetical protein